MSAEDCNKAIPAKALPPRAHVSLCNPTSYGQSILQIELENGALISFEKPLKNA
jgi:hypothetical protein